MMIAVKALQVFLDLYFSGAITMIGGRHCVEFAISNAPIPQSNILKDYNEIEMGIRFRVSSARFYGPES
jgi:hypothetical protein